MTKFRKAAGSLGILFMSLSPLAHADEATIIVDSPSLLYIGKISQEANRRLFDAYRSHKDEIKWLAIRSKGGSVEDGLELGKWVHEQGLGIKVYEYCLSSCANYVFPAASERLLSSFAVIGYHGGACSTHFDRSALMQHQAGMSEAEIRKDNEAFNAYLTQQCEKERSFYKGIGVRDDLATLGQSPEYETLFETSPAALGWTYSPKAFEKLGIRGIQVINPPWRPNFPASDATVITIDF
ncbi:hypothetical protein [Niveibacterium terrae]|uniref:hypothetical protein n=1 Tax=Niveibacterium terrae TaxID=3373598 RepID=UPI003A94BFA0